VAGVNPWILVLLGSAAQGCWGAVAVVNPWIPVLVGSAAQGCWGAVALVNPWILVLLGGAAQGCWGAVAVVNLWILVLLGGAAQLDPDLLRNAIAKKKNKLASRLMIRKALASFSTEMHEGLQMDLNKYTRAEVIRKLQPVGAGKHKKPSLVKKEKTTKLVKALLLSFVGRAEGVS